MKLNIDLSQRPELKTLLSPQLIESLELLQLTNIELSEFLQQELEKNPVLETNDNNYDDEQNDPAQKLQESENLEIDDNSESALPEENTFDDNWQDYFDDGRDMGYSSAANYDDDKDSFETYTASKVSLFQHLHEQLLLNFSDHNEFKIALYLITTTDDRGYLAESLESIAQYFNTTVDKINAIRKVILNLEPLGICSLNLKEYLLLQLQNRKKTEYSRWTQLIISEYFEFVQQRKIDEIARRIKVIKPKIIEKCIDEISQLAPYPAHTYSNQQEIEPYVIPDIIYRKIDNNWIIIINDEFLPQLRISPYYKNLYNSNNLTESEKKYLQENLSSAENLIKAIHQRNRTLYKVASRILERQIDFFEKGFVYLKPMILKDIANDIKMHESTISRCTRGKYAQTPYGLFELKFFFTNGLPLQTGEQISSAVIKEKIKNIILSEDPKNPISDIDIWKKLTDEGLIVERKTITNYRDELGILPKHLRRRYI